MIALPVKPDLIIHTGDITQLSKDQEFDDADQIFIGSRPPVFHVPGEHDMLDEDRARPTSPATARDRWARAGTASTTTACISSP